MLTLEKLFYQHQYKPLELSTYLSDYLRDAKSFSFKPEACSKRLYQLFHRFVNKFSSFQDPNLSHLILSISFSVLTYLCETSRDSFVSFFEFGLTTLLMEEIPLTDMTQNENTFSEFISLLHLLCDSYTQTELAQLCHLIVPLLDTILLPHISSRTHILVSSLIIKLCDSLSPSVVVKLKSERSFSTQIVKSGKRISALGDILLQSDVVESLFRLTSRTERTRLSDILFASPAVSGAFREISEDAFERGSRHFLNTLNASLASTCKVFSYPCVSGGLDETVLCRPQELEHMWADFNTSSQSLTLFISHPLDPSSTEWVTLCMRKESFTQLTLSSKDGFQLDGEISTNKSEICEVFPHSSGPVSLRLSFRHEHDPTLGMSAALGYTGSIINLPVEPDSSKRPLYRISTSMQAIRISTLSSGALDTQVTSTSTPTTLSPILMSPPRDSRPSPVLSEQQTTPVAPIPPVNPLTSTPIRKSSFTPVFTPNNIASVRDQTECVLASASSLHSSARLAIQGSRQASERAQKQLINTNPRRFTPSSLATHVSTPGDVAAAEGNSEMRDAQRAKIVTQEIEKGLEQQINKATSPLGKNKNIIDKTKPTDNSNHVTTPRSIRVTNNRKGKHEVSHSYKPIATKAPRKQLTPSPPKVIAPTPMSVDLVTNSNQDNDSIQAEATSNSCSPLNNDKENNYNSLNGNIPFRALNSSNIRIDLTNSEDSEEFSPSPVSIGAKKLALSTSSLSYQILSPVLMQNKFRRIKPRDSGTQNDSLSKEGDKRNATRVTHPKHPTRQKHAPSVKHTSSRQRAEKLLPVSTSEDSNSPFRSRSSTLTRSRSRNCKVKSDDETLNSGIQDSSIIPVQSFEKKTSNSRRLKKRESPKMALVSDFPAKQIYNKLSRDCIGSISSANSLTIQTKNTLPTKKFSFKLDASNSNRVNSLEKHLQQYEDNLKFAYSNSLFAIDKSRSEKVRKLFVQMKQLMVSENKDVFSKYNDWYHETRNLVTAISEMRQYDLDSKSYLYEQFQLAVKQVEQSIQKEQVSAIKQRIHSFFIKI